MKPSRGNQHINGPAVATSPNRLDGRKEAVEGNELALPSPQRGAPGLTPVVRVDADKCRNCHACIAACPVKYCNVASGEVVEINSDRCIACGCCIDACTHGARLPVDDW